MGATAVAEDEWWRITDAEWREYQAIPGQGYSHRYWIESRLIATRLNGAIERIKGTNPA
jgi:hypothetical protein